MAIRMLIASNGRCKRQVSIARHVRSDPA